jgi:hypothetical protein
VEISDSSATDDRSAKAALYGRTVAAEVFIVDITGAAGEAFGDNSSGSRERRRSGSLMPRLAPAVIIDVAALLA